MRKYRQGRRLRTFADVKRTKMFWHQGKVYHEGWIKSWSFHYIEGQLNQGNLYQAMPKEVACRSKK